MNNPPQQPWHDPGAEPQPPAAPGESTGQPGQPTPGGAYQPQPAFPVPRATDPGPAPGQVRVAAILLLVQCALGLVSLVFIPSLMQRTMAQQPKQPGVDPALLEAVLNGVIVFIIVGSIIWTGVWVLFIVKAYRGRDWARIVLTIFLAVGLVAVPFSIPQYLHGATGPVPLVALVPTVIVEVLTLVLLWREPAKSWFPAKTAYAKAQHATKLELSR